MRSTALPIRPKPSKPLPTRFPVLVSYAFLKDWKASTIEEYFATLSCCDVLLDSGAFTAKNAGYVIELDDYCAFLDRWQDQIFRYMALDVVGDSAATDENLQRMLDRGYRPVPVHVLNDDEERMNYLFSVSDYVALAGLRRPHRGAAPKTYVKRKMAWAAGRQVHWLGYTQGAMLRAFRPYSADCSSMNSGARYGVVDVYLGRGKWERINREQAAREPISTNVIDAVRSAGITMADLRNMERWRMRRSMGIGYEQHIPTVVNHDSWVRYSLELWRDFGVRLFLADFVGNLKLSANLRRSIAQRTQEYNDNISQQGVKQ